MATKKIKYTEPRDYFPKEIRDKYFKKTNNAASTTKKTSGSKKKK